MEEQWKSIEGYEGIYEVSNKGRVRSLTRFHTKKCNGGHLFPIKINGRILRPRVTKLGYLNISLSNGAKYDMTTFRLHRLVAKAFIPNPNNLPEVHHIDHNKLNNSVDNLKWVTSKENTRAAINAGKHLGGFRKGLEHHNSKFSDEQILKFYELEKQGLKRFQIADIMNCTRGYVTEILSYNKRKIQAF